jgi:hypothetical protein
MLIKEKNLELYLCDKLSEFDFYTDLPFTIFEKSPFIDELSYKKLVKEIYEFDDFDFVFTNKGNKKLRSVNLSNIGSLSDGTFKTFCLAILGYDFYKWFERTHLPYFEKKFLNFRVTNPRSFLMKSIRRIVKYTRAPIGLYYTEVEYSSLSKNSFIPPHTDVNKKRLSFVFYLPSNESLNKEQRKELGTVFWKPKDTALSPLRRFDCGLLVGDEYSRFYEDYEIARVATYEPNKIACFIKTDNSWHTVEKIKSDYDRRAIVINVWEL